MAYVWQISIIHFKDKSIVQGTILKGKPGDQKQQYTFSPVLVSYFRNPLKNRPLIVQLSDNQYSVSTDDHGRFSVELDHEVSSEIKVESDNKQLEIVQSYPMVFKDSDYPVALISDVDDTILVSYTASNWNRVRTILFTSPQKRKSISFSKGILDVINSHSGRIFYVSKSESNLFGLLTSFIRSHNLPEGNLFLTPYLRLNQLLNPKKGKDYKEQTISTIIELSPGKRFILMGDDTQQDMAVYTSIVEKYPDRIFKVYIRKTRKNLLGNKRELLDKLHTLAVPFLYFSDTDLVINELQMINKITN